MEKTMKGIVKSGPGKGATYRTDLPIPEIGDDDVLIKVRATAVCGTDMHIYHWNEFAAKRLPLPIVFGHETAGDIVQMGKNVKGFKIGDRISVETHIPCNNCKQCHLGNYHLCNNVRLFGLTEPGAFAEYAKVDQKVAYKIDDDIDYKHAAMLEAMGAGVHGAMKADVKDKDILISGCGAIGLMVVGACKVLGAKKIIVTDIVEEKLELAKQMGAHALINALEKDVVKTVMELTDGEGVDAAIDISGSGRAIVADIKSLRKAGIMVSVGLPDGEISINLTEDLIYREIVYTGVSGRRIFETWDACMKILKSDDFALEPLIGGVYKMEDFESAFKAIEEGKPGKMILIP